MSLECGQLKFVYMNRLEPKNSTKIGAQSWDLVSWAIDSVIRTYHCTTEDSSALKKESWGYDS
jgi:hypothetical protein